MRKTQEEVKAELIRRRNRYEAERRVRNKRLLGGGITFAVCLTVVLLLGRMPFASPDDVYTNPSNTVTDGRSEGISTANSASAENSTAETSENKTSDPFVSQESFTNDTPTSGGVPSEEQGTSGGETSEEPSVDLPPEEVTVRPDGYDLMANMRAEWTYSRKPDDAFIEAQMQFAVNLLQQALQAQGGRSVLVSPLSTQLALSMAAGGAYGETLQEMEQVLGNGLSLARLNEYLHTYTASLPSADGAALELASSIWFPESGRYPRRDFLQANANYFGAGAYQAPSDQLCGLINDWIRSHTAGKVDTLLDGLPDDVAMVLLNTVLFDGTWKEKYEEKSLHEMVFIAHDGTVGNVTMMRSDESVLLEDDDGTIGVLKPYENERYAFVALLPDDEVDILEYVASLTADDLTRILESRRTAKVSTEIPKFTFSGDYLMNDLLKAMGMRLAFDGKQANFARMFNGGGVSLELFRQKVVIEVSEHDVVASNPGAAVPPETSEGGPDERPSTPATSDPDGEFVVLDHPFLYMILDTETNLPLFLGVMTETPQ